LRHRIERFANKVFINAAKKTALKVVEEVNNERKKLEEHHA
tara:strand:+ start:1991 stop:2113 length:123 start_codon:yes stop_codon:yes gene_type:complete